MDPSKPPSPKRGVVTLPPKPPEAEWTVPRYTDGTGPCRVVLPLAGGEGGGDGPPGRVVRSSPRRRRATDDWLVVVYTREPTLLGKRFVLEHDLTRVGRGADNHIVLDGDAVSRRHAHFERRGDGWLVVDDGSTNGTHCNDEQLSREVVLRNGDRVKIGPTIFKFLSGPGVEAQYHEEIYRITITDGLMQISNKRYLYEALDREILRTRRNGRDLALLLFDVDHLVRVNDAHGHLAGDFVLKELARLVTPHVRRDEVFARHGGDELAVVLPETSLDDAVARGEAMRRAVGEHRFVFQGETIRVTLSGGAAQLEDGDRAANDLIKRADERLSTAKNDGRDQIHGGHDVVPLHEKAR